MRARRIGDGPVFWRFLCKVLSDKLAGSTFASGGIPLKRRIETWLRMSEPGHCFGSIEGIARQIGVSRRQLLRVLKELCEEGILEHEKKGVCRLPRKPEIPDAPRRASD